MKNRKFGRRATCMLLAFIMVVSIVPTSLLVIAEEDYSHLIGYWVEFNKDSFYMYKEPGSQAQGFFKDEMPEYLEILDVKTAYYGSTLRVYYKLGLIEDPSAASDFYTHPWIWEKDVDLVEPQKPEENPEGFIEGQVGLVMDGEVVTDITIPRGEKTYIFTDLTDKVEGTPSYQWQILVDKEDNRWANILYYEAPYAALSESLLANSRDPESGRMTIRCIVTSGGYKYVSGTLDVNMPAREEKANDAQAVSSGAKKTKALSAGNMARAGDDTEDSGDDKIDEAFQIEVSYVYWNNSSLAHDIHGEGAADTFTVTLFPSVSYDGQKNHPTIPGYKAYIRDDNATGEYREYEALEKKNDPGSMAKHKYVEADPIIFDHETEGRKVLIYYLPVEVTFRVNHYIQNLENDEYKLIHTDVLSGLSDYPVGEGLEYTTTDQYADIAGFTSLFYDPNTRISANNKTEVDIYYDRNYYVVDFDLSTPDGQKGYGVMPLYVRYGTQLMLSTPTAPGYAFTNWSFVQVYNRIESTVDGNIKITEEQITDNSIIDLYDNPAAMLTIKHNVDYKANWDTATTTYTVIYWIENADDNNFSMAGFKNVEAKPNDVVSANDDLSHSDKAYLTFSSTLSDKDVIVKGDGTTAVNAYYLRTYYTITFSSSGRQCLTDVHVHDDSCPDGNCALESHTHTDACGVASQTCGLIEHDHIKTPIANGGCLSCDIKEHLAHTSECNTNCANTHVHTVTCYEGATNSVAPSNTNPSIGGDNSSRQNGVIGRTGNNWNYEYWIYFDGVWYDYTGDITARGQVADLESTCPESKNHIHINECYIDSLHIHTLSCYNCGTQAHTHSVKCYTYSCGKIDHVHNADCARACQIQEHTHGNCGSQFQIVKRKYGASISDIWQEVWDALDHTEGIRWQPSGTTYTQVLVYFPFMPHENITLTSNSGGTKNFKMHYMLESLDSDGDLDDRQNYTELATVDAKYGYLTKAEDFFNIVGFKQYKSNPAFGTNNQMSTAGDVYLYYEREESSLVFMSNGYELTSLNRTLMYEQPVGAEYEPNSVPYPTNKEQNAVKFVGWYTTENCADGTEFLFDGSTTMPLEGLYLYAKWEDTKWDVTVYQEEPTGTDDEILKEYSDVPFGTLLTTYGSEPERKAPVDGYIFAGWYYVDENGEESRFDFNTMAVKHDYTIYAKWTSEVPVPYTVRYITEIDGQEVEIAEQTKGVSLAGISKSFNAKVDKELYNGYQTGYFPEMREQTYKMEDGENIITFTYSHDSDISYRIKHVFTSPNLAKYTRDKSETLTLIWETRVDETSSAVLNISFKGLITKDEITKKLTGLNYSSTEIDSIWNEIIQLSPDAYSKRLILEAHTTADDNEAVFNWEGRTDRYMYEVHHLYQSFDDDDGYDEIGDPQIFEVVAGSVVSFEHILVKGYEYSHFKTNHQDGDQNTTVFAPTVGAGGEMGDGLIINVYYKRETYNYTVKFYDDELYTPISGVQEVKKTGRYGDVIKISGVAQTIDGYDLSNGSHEEELVFDNQEIICYYKRRSVKYEYILVGVGGSLNNFQEEVFYGDTPAAVKLYILSGYIVEGWEYSVDGGEFAPVTNAQATVGVNGSTLQPVKPTLEDMGKRICFKVTLTPTSFTITNSGDVANDQAFIYVITDNVSGASVRVTVMGNTSTTIQGMPEGQYTVMLEDNWSWRYDRVSASNEMTPSTVEFRWDLNFDGEESVTFTYSDPNDKYVSTTDRN